MDSMEYVRVSLLNQKIKIYAYIYLTCIDNNTNRKEVKNILLL